MFILYTRKNNTNSSVSIRSPQDDKMASNLTKKQVNLVREIWQTNCGKVEQLTKVGVELFIG